MEGCTLKQDFAALHQAQDRRARKEPQTLKQYVFRDTFERMVLRQLHSPEGLRGAVPDDHPDVESAIDFIHQARKEAHND